MEAFLSVRPGAVRAIARADGGSGRPFCFSQALLITSCNSWRSTSFQGAIRPPASSRYSRNVTLASRGCNIGVGF